MSNYWEQANRAWMDLSRREQVLILITLCVIPVVLVFVYSVEPALKRLQGVDAEIARLELDVQSDLRVLELMQRTEIPNPDIKAQAELDALTQRYQGLEHNLNVFSQRLVQPDEMLTLLHSVLTPNTGLAILSAQSLPVEPLDLSAVNSGSESQVDNTDTRERAMKDAVIFKHPFELELQGSYSALFEYLQKLENLHQGFFWNQLTFEAGEYPNANV
ncbi:MAG: hypothetical protein ACPGPF_07120, partial [Pontibacterium sp.]